MACTEQLCWKKAHLNSITTFGLSIENRSCFLAGMKIAAVEYVKLLFWSFIFRIHTYLACRLTGKEEIRSF